jgi:hypothetical protein
LNPCGYFFALPILAIGSRHGDQANRQKTRHGLRRREQLSKSNGYYYKIHRVEGSRSCVAAIAGFVVTKPVISVV